jgi:hypothetical protein
LQLPPLGRHERRQQAGSGVFFSKRHHQLPFFSPLYSPV